MRIGVTSADSLINFGFSYLSSFVRAGHYELGDRNNNEL